MDDRQNFQARLAELRAGLKALCEDQGWEMTSVRRFAGDGAEVLSVHPQGLSVTLWWLEEGSAALAAFGGDAQQAVTVEKAGAHRPVLAFRDVPDWPTLRRHVMAVIANG